MSSIYGGNGSIGSNWNWPGGYPSFTNVSSATNTTPIQITTATAHGFQTGDRVIVQSVQGNTAANSPGNTAWTIVVLNSTQFTLTGSAGNGAFTVAGFCYSVSLSPALTLPSDGDAFTVSSVNVALQGLADRTQMIGKILTPYSTGAAQLINQYIVQAQDDTWATWSSSTAGAASWAIITNDLLNPNGAGAFGGTSSLSDQNMRANHGDFFDISVSLGEATGFATPVAFGVSSVWGCNTASWTGKTLGGERCPGSYDGPVTLRTLLNPTALGTTATISSVVAGVATITGLSNFSSATYDVGATLTIWGAATAANNGSFPVTVHVSSSSVKIANAAAVAADANNGSLKWRLDNFKFDIAIAAYGIGAGPAFTLKGHRGIIVNHYRPNTLFSPGGPP